VAGDITNPADLPNNISATYSGTALGNVTRGAAKYIAAGDMNMTYDFKTRSGTMNIDNFDNMNASGLISEKAHPSKALFRGDLAGTGVTGNVNGAFVNDGVNKAAGVIGEFGLSGAGVSAVGTIAGAKVP
jgi:trimeric autotransporter adhesin